MVSLYFSFPDGVFDYVCSECTALCCRDNGFAGSLGREMGGLIQLYPSLEAAVVARRGQIVTVTTSGPCHFLESDNTCAVENRHGRAMKPGVCLLFPFNAFSFIGDTLVVSPHFLCPLRLHVPARPGEVEGTHERLASLVQESELTDEVYLRGLARQLHLPRSGSAGVILAREIAFRDRCGAGLHAPATFSRCLVEAAADPDRLAGTLARASALLGLPEAAGHTMPDDFDRILLAIAPTLRLHLFQLSADGILVALAVGERMLRRIQATSGATPTPQGLFNLFLGVAPALRLVGIGDDPGRISRRRPQVPAFGDPAMVFAAYRTLKGLGGGGGVLDLLEREMRGLNGRADRTAFLVEMGDLVLPDRRRRKPMGAAAPAGAA